MPWVKQIVNARLLSSARKKTKFVVNARYLLTKRKQSKRQFTRIDNRYFNFDRFDVMLVNALILVKRETGSK